MSTTVTSCLWFDTGAGEAARYDCVIDGAALGPVSTYPEGGYGSRDGQELGAELTLDGDGQVRRRGARGRGSEVRSRHAPGLDTRFAPLDLLWSAARSPVGALLDLLWSAARTGVGEGS